VYTVKSYLKDSTPEVYQETGEGQSLVLGEWCNKHKNQCCFKLQEAKLVCVYQCVCVCVCVFTEPNNSHQDYNISAEAAAAAASSAQSAFTAIIWPDVDMFSHCTAQVSPPSVWMPHYKLNPHIIPPIIDQNGNETER